MEFLFRFHVWYIFYHTKTLLSIEAVVLVGANFGCFLFCMISSIKSFMELRLR